jgi:sulfiredoxin
MSLQSRNIATTQTLPLTSILRPIPPVLDEPKITSMAFTLQDDKHLPPVDVLHYTSPAGKDFYFAFGGCHRLQAYERAEVRSVECKVMRVSRGMLRVYLGGSLDAVLGE